MLNFLLLAALLCTLVLLILLAPMWRDPARRPGMPLLMGILLLIPLSSLLIYAQIGGGPNALLHASDPDAAVERIVQQEMDGLIQGLRDRLAAQPDDLAGWLMLARTLSNEGRLHEAAQAFAEAMKHGGDQMPVVLAQYADVIATLRGSLQGRPRELAESALAIDPAHQQALWLAGSSAYQAGEKEQALLYFERLHAQLDEDSEEGQAMAENLRKIRRELHSR